MHNSQITMIIMLKVTNKILTKLTNCPQQQLEHTAAGKVIQSYQTTEDFTAQHLMILIHHHL